MFRRAFTSVRPEIDTGKSLPGVTQTSATFSKIPKTRLFRLASTVRLPDPGPSIANGPLMLSWPVVRTIVPVTEKTIVSASGIALACANASRRLPAPLSLVLVTVNVAAQSDPVDNANSDATSKRFILPSPEL